MKMMAHAVSGVEKGMNAGGRPVEVMGLMLGHLCPESPETLVVSDCFALPIEGAETRVLADDQEVINFMIGLGESLEKTRQERFMGWYHSHPFDVEVHSHCFMSSTDISTQLGWQRAEDRNGNPWLAIVIDPLRSLAKGRPEMGAFRAYPPEYTAPANELPDGTTETDDKARIERWGAAWNRYHALEVKFFMSSLSANVLGLISKNFLWMSAISSTPTIEKEYRDRFAERVNGVQTKLDKALPMLKAGRGNHLGDLGLVSRSLGGNASLAGTTPSLVDLDLGMGTGATQGASSERAEGARGNPDVDMQVSAAAAAAGSGSARNSNQSQIDKTIQAASDLSMEQIQTQLSQISKHLLFAAVPGTTRSSSSTSAQTLSGPGATAPAAPATAPPP
ncbi:COP9 signalosome complex subunit 5 [Hondaea fermentalgiana]|uniref:COP9 signalosome complex subunit 5 n=1 Tax=Hondaea fermentalgiana TaxID=2315210 RepID=A0A2R5GXA2_9STRA|nr:COP9 signalosome complex subunit 5 [Hondaea fermentalgiana]|eukprot:GBG33041.1 COP9 signalosome complex subunit 5 [Hondaea fermentalgiana]